MKKLLIFIFLLCAKSVFAQKDTVGLNIPYANNTIAYERVFNMPNTTQNLLYANAGIWLAETHVNYINTQLTLKDDNLLRLIGRVNNTYTVVSKILWNTNYWNIRFNFTLQIDCKDNKYRVRIYNIQNVNGTEYASADSLMQFLNNSKPFYFNNGSVYKTKDFQQIFKALNIVTDGVMDDINKEMMEEDNF